MYAMRSHLLATVAVLVFITVSPVTAWTADGHAADPVDRLMDRPQHLMFCSYLGRSHMMPYLEILKPLADRSHKVTVVTDQYDAIWVKPNFPKFHIRLIPLEVMDGMLSRIPEVMANLSKPGSEITGTATHIEYFTLPYYKALTDSFREIFLEEKPDLLLCDLMSSSCSDMADTLGMKYGVTISSLPPGVSDAPYINGWSSSMITPTTLNMRLWPRFYNKFIFPLRVITAARRTLNKFKALREELGIKVPIGPPGQRFAHALKVINTFMGFEAARPVDPLVQLVGPIRSHVNSTMPHDIQQWINNLSSGSGSSSSSNKCVIYVAFGQIVDLSDNVLASLMTSLITTLDQGLADGVIWAVSNTKRDRFPADVDPRVLLVPFAPQKALLASADVCLFVSHGGAESAHEAMYEAKPLLVIPFYGDQPMNAAKMSEAGFAEFIPHHDVTPARVQAKLTHMLKPNPGPQNLKAPYAETYAAAARRQQALVRTLTKHNTEAAADMLLYFARYGWEHLVLASAKMPWYKATDADIYAVLVIATVLLLGSVVWGLRVVARIVASMLGAAGSGSKGQNGRSKKD